jgi:hypothetical protein
MNTAVHLLARTKALGIRLDRDDGDIVAEGMLTKSIIVELRQHKAELLAALSQGWQPTEAELSEAVNEVFEERAAIREHCGGELRQKAEIEARAALRVYEYRLSDYGPNGPWLVFLAPGYDLTQAERALRNQFGARRVSAVREKPIPRQVGN